MVGKTRGGGAHSSSEPRKYFWSSLFLKIQFYFLLGRAAVRGPLLPPSFSIFSTQEFLCLDHGKTGFMEGLQYWVSGKGGSKHQLWHSPAGVNILKWYDLAQRNRLGPPKKHSKAEVDMQEVYWGKCLCRLKAKKQE